MREETLFVADRYRIVRVTPDPSTGLPPKDIVRHPGAVVVVPIGAEGEVCLIRNYRLSVDDELVEFPAGTRDPAESIEATARRELEEETGYVAGRWKHLGDLCMSPGILDERMSVFVARDLSMRQARHEKDERIRNCPVRIAELDDWVRKGRIVDAKTLATILLLKMHEPEFS